MTGNDLATQPTRSTTDASLSEIRKVREGAERLAKGDAPEEADQLRVLAGYVHQLAEHVERLIGVGAVPGATPSTGTPADPTPAVAGARANDPSSPQHDRDVVLEEDRSPEDAPAEPLDDRTRSDTAASGPGTSMNGPESARGMVTANDAEDGTEEERRETGEWQEEQSKRAE